MSDHIPFEIQVNPRNSYPRPSPKIKMSRNIPFEIQLEIINRLPVKSLVRFRSVSKPWKSLIDSSEFIAGYGVRQTHPPRLLACYKDPVDTKEKCVSFVDDDDFTQQQLAPTVPVFSKLLDGLKIAGSSQGLLCLYGYYRDPDHPRYNVATEVAVLWNPSIRKSVCITVPGESGWSDTVLGFGVCPITNDPTIVKIRNVDMYTYFMEGCTNRVEVFTLSGGSWRNLSPNLPRDSIQVTWSHVVMDNIIYWLAVDDDECEPKFTKNLIISFDMRTQEFRVVDLPDCLAGHGFVGLGAYVENGLISHRLSISKVCDSLAVLQYTEYNVDEYIPSCVVWIMDDAAPSSFTKIFTINALSRSMEILEFTEIVGFTKSGEPILERQDDYKKPAALAVYEPLSRHMKNIGIYGRRWSLFVSSYMETLLLIDQSDCSLIFQFPTLTEETNMPRLQDDEL